MSNFSFEIAGPGPGFAQDWVIQSRAEQTAAFGFNGASDVIGCERFERWWRLPRYIGSKTNTDAKFSFMIFARVETANAEPFSLADGQTLTFKIDRGSTQTITFAAAGFVDITIATAEEVADYINAYIIGGYAYTTAGDSKIIIASNTLGSDSYVEITGGTANTALNFDTTEVRGTSDDVQLLSIRGDNAEAFERLWDIAVVLGNTRSLQAAQVTTDGALWPTGHAALISVLSSEAVSVCLFDGLVDDNEDFENLWLLPGSAVGKYNNIWYNNYWDGDTFRFLPDQISVFVFTGSLQTEAFETGWKDNQNSKFIFTPADITEFTFSGAGGPFNNEPFNESDWLLVLSL